MVEEAFQLVKPNIVVCNRNRNLEGWKKNKLKKEKYFPALK
jgi:hypothetical protein